MKKLNVAVLFGGRSSEHEVSMLSARSVICGLDPEKYNIIPIAITRQGAWLGAQDAHIAIKAKGANGKESSVMIIPGEKNRHVLYLDSETTKFGLIEADIVFPVLHGSYGEDGTVQGLLEMAGLPYVGCGVSGSSLAMDKVLSKHIWQKIGLPVVPCVVVLRSQLSNWEQVEKITAQVEYPAFVKPANAGSSVGISKVNDKSQLKRALELAAKYDRKMLVEKAIEEPREIEVGAIGNDVPRVSVPGQLAYRSEFYDYNTKYWGDDPVDMLIPAPITPEQTQEMQRLAKIAWSALDLNGFARIDFMMDKYDKIWLNEVNTIPGFTNFSMFSKLWEKTGVPYGELLDTLINLGLERFEDRAKNIISPEQ